jgi:hypothetical protein
VDDVYSSMKEGLLLANGTIMEELESHQAAGGGGDDDVEDECRPSVVPREMVRPPHTHTVHCPPLYPYPPPPPTRSP